MAFPSQDSPPDRSGNLHGVLAGVLAQELIYRIVPSV
jgi:hypothetical protein